MFEIAASCSPCGVSVVVRAMEGLLRPRDNAAFGTGASAPVAALHETSAPCAARFGDAPTVGRSRRQRAKSPTCGVLAGPPSDAREITQAEGDSCLLAHR